MVREWLSSRTPAPPGRLAARLDAAVPEITAEAQDRLPGSLVDAASAILRDTLERASTERNGPAALDLLAADALITYAVEAAAEDCERFAVLADEMIARLSAVAGNGRGEPK